MSPLRPDILDCWIFRVGEASPGVGTGGPAAGSTPPGAEILLLRRAPSRILPGLWQCVSGSLEPGERVALGALRELVEETGIGPDDIEAFYDIDLVNQFHEPSVDAILLAAVFAVRIRPDAVPVLSHEHDAMRWLDPDAAHHEVVWPGYREAIDRIRRDILDPERAPWFALDLEGRRRPR
jgi:8-oxo-dGTP pyrophosphatase MutT (NUDIX family)